ncbi:hypothetical protein [Sporomusa aerivorans]|uniref:hypothetical protein n=1 Tax=Sporomusa aerivorans TaxID=204936 RepID=UPI00352AD613
MPKLISGMFSSVSDAQLIIAAHAYDDEDTLENATDKFSDNSQFFANEASYSETMSEESDDTVQ